MSSKLDVVKDYHDMAYTNPPASAVEAAEKYLSDDYQGFDKDGNVTMDKQTYVGMNHLLYSAFKDFRGVVHDYLEEDDGVMVIFHFEGTHTGDFDLSAMGMGVIPATGKRVVTPESKTKFMVEGDKIVGTLPISGGFDSFLEAVGAAAEA